MVGLVTKLTSPGDGRLLIETQDYRSEYAFEEFCEKISERLGIRLSPAVQGDELAPRSFSFEGQTFAAAWEDEYGCFIQGREAQRTLVKRMQAMLRDEG